MSKISSIMIITAYESVGDTSKIEYYGRSAGDWVRKAMPQPVVSVNYEDKTIPTLIRPYLDMESEYVVVLFSDTPLITQKTVAQAIEKAKTGQNVVKLTRGFVFRTSFVATIDKVLTDQTFYCDEQDFIATTSFKQVALVNEIMRTRILEYHMERGVYIQDPATTYIGCEVSIGKGVRIAPNNKIDGKSIIKDNAVIEIGNNITDSIIGENAEILSSRVWRSYVGKRTTVGPYAHLRKDNVVGDDCHVGDFVELKKCRIGNGCKMGHLAYLGDVVMGENCNVGAGAVFANYDGKNKFSTFVGDRVFIGSKATIVSPCRLESDSFIAAHSIITADVPQGALAIGRARQVIKENWDKNKYLLNFVPKDEE